MLTILNAIELSKEYLEKREVESPRINAELLLAHILKCKRMDLYLRFEQPLKDDEVAEYRELIRRRGKREPVQYIIGSVEFYGIDFFVDRNVLIPRQETEHLVEEIINIYKSKNKVNIIDIGTGSGNIAVSLARNLPNAIIQGIDKSSAAIEIAEKNAKKNNFQYLRLDCDASNVKLCKYYENLGFILVGQKQLPLGVYNLYQKELI